MLRYLKKTCSMLTLLAVSLLVSIACSEKLPVTETPPHVDPTENPEEKELSILFIGNSFTMDAVTHLPGLLSSAGIKKVHLIHMYYGGRLVQQYNSGWETSADYTVYECKPGNAAWTTYKGKTLKESAESLRTVQMPSDPVWEPFSAERGK